MAALLYVILKLFTCPDGNIAIKISFLIDGNNCGNSSVWPTNTTLQKLAFNILLFWHHCNHLVFLLCTMNASSWPNRIQQKFKIFFGFSFQIILCYSSPLSHPFIHDIERSYLESEVSNQVRFDSYNNQVIPWRSILTSGPVLALVFAQVSTNSNHVGKQLKFVIYSTTFSLVIEFFYSFLCCLWQFSLQLAQDWGFYVTETYLPKYLNDILGVSIGDNGILSSIPHVAELILLFFVGVFSDWMIANQVMSITNARKLFVSIGMLSQF